MGLIDSPTPTLLIQVEYKGHRLLYVICPWTVPSIYESVCIKYVDIRSLHASGVLTFCNKNKPFLFILGVIMINGIVGIQTTEKALENNWNT